MIPSITYRKATLADIPALITLRIDFLKEVTRTDIVPNEIEKELEIYFSRHLLNGDYVNWLAESDSDIVSTGGILFWRIPPNFVNISGEKAYILNVFTVKSFRRKGISKEIFSKLMLEAKHRGICQVSLHATEAGQPLYEQFGFIKKNSEMTWGTHI